MTKNFIGGKIELTANQSALSIVRKNRAEHAFLVLEAIDENGERLIYNAHLVKNETSNGTKALVVFKQNVSVQELIAYAADCNAYTWPITQNEMTTVLELIQYELERAQANEINYLLGGKASALASIVGSTQYLTSTQVSAEKVEACFKNIETKGNKLTSQVVSRESIRSLLVDGHNCLSWTIAIVKAININVPNDFTQCLVVNPKKLEGQNTLERNNNNNFCRLM